MSTDTMANLLVIVITIFAYHLSTERACEASGGKYLRGLFSFECVVVK